MQCHRHEPRICAPRKLLTAVQQIRVEDRVRRTRKTLKLFLMSHLRSSSAAIELLTLTGGSVEDMLHLPRTVSLYESRVPGRFVKHAGPERSKSRRRGGFTGHDAHDRIEQARLYQVPV
jgi:hypothetical protein